MIATPSIDLLQTNRKARRAPTSSTSPGLVMTVVCLALGVVVAAMASLNVALPSIARDIHASQTDLVWVIDAYSLAFAALLLPAGAIGDRYGRRRALLAGLVIFGGGSAVAMTVTSASELIGIRAVIGLGAALVMPATLSTITSTFPESKRTRAVSIWAAVAGGAAVLGLLASGALLTGFSWRSIFALNVLLSALAVVGTLRFVPESADPDAPRLDIGGALIAVSALVALVFSVIEAPTYGWLAPRTLAGLGMSGVLGATFVRWELRQRTPLLNPRLFGKRPLSAGSTSIFVQFFSFYGYSFVALQYLQIVRGDTALIAALQVLPLAGTMIPISRLAPQLTARYGNRKVGASGLAVLGAGLVVVSRLGTHSPYWQMAVGLVLLGAGLGLAMTPATTSITESLPAAQQGVGSALNDLSREVGGAIGIAVIGSILAGTYSSNVNITGLPSRIASTVKGSYAIASLLPAPIPERAHSAFVSAMHVALLIAAGAALSAAVVAITVLSRKRRRPAPVSPEVVETSRADRTANTRRGTLRVIVAGAGIGGLSAAIALRRAGHEVVVLEQALRLEPIGAGITLFPNAMNALDNLGVAGSVRAAGAGLGRSTVLTSKGQELSALPSDLVEGSVAVHRGDLQAVLLQATGEVRLGAELVSVRQTSAEVVVTTAGGTEERADLLVGADGLWSAARTSVATALPRYAGYTAWRGVSSAIIEPGKHSESWGVGERFGMVDIGSRTYWYATAGAPEGQPDDPVERQSALLARFSDWHEPITTVLQATPASEILRNDVYFLDPLSRWSCGRVVLLGDAAHATTPGIGQGAALAIEDAVSLAGELDGTEDLRGALARYESIRRLRAELVLKLSRRVDRAAQLTSPLGWRLRNIALRSTPPRLENRQLAEILLSRLPEVPHQR